MKNLLRRYTPDMNQALSLQTITSLVSNALIRGVVFGIFLQLLTYASTGKMSGFVQVLVLSFIFSLFNFSFDLIEKYWAQSKLTPRG